jgi:DNA-binding NarL/FixJ family response regulator
MILDISERVVKFHFQNIENKLNADKKPKWYQLRWDKLISWISNQIAPIRRTEV